MMIGCITLLIVLHAVVAVVGSECPSDPGLKTIIEGVTKDVDPKKLAGTWMDLVVPTMYLGILESSFTVYKAEEDGKTLTLSGHDFLKSGVSVEYTSTMKKKETGIKGAFSFEGKFATDGTEFNNDAYFFHVDDNVIAFYTCRPDSDIESSWDVFILVNASKKKELQKQGKTSEVMSSLNNAKSVMKSMEDQNLSWMKKNELKFGLMGDMMELDINLLRSEVVKDESGNSSPQDQSADNKDQNTQKDIHTQDNSGLSDEDSTKDTKLQNDRSNEITSSDIQTAQTNKEVKPKDVQPDSDSSSSVKPQDAVGDKGSKIDMEHKNDRTTEEKSSVFDKTQTNTKTSTTNSQPKNVPPENGSAKNDGANGIQRGSEKQ